jgi:proline dehydrogenase
MIPFDVTHLLSIDAKALHQFLDTCCSGKWSVELIESDSLQLSRAVQGAMTLTAQEVEENRELLERTLATILGPGILQGREHYRYWVPTETQKTMVFTAFK